MSLTIFILTVIGSSLLFLFSIVIFNIISKVIKFNITSKVDFEHEKKIVALIYMFFLIVYLIYGFYSIK